MFSQTLIGGIDACESAISRAVHKYIESAAHVSNVNVEIVIENVINLEPLCGIVKLFVLSSALTALKIQLRSFNNRQPMQKLFDLSNLARKRREITIVFGGFAKVLAS